MTSSGKGVDIVYIYRIVLAILFSISTFFLHRTMSQLDIIADKLNNVIVRQAVLEQKVQTLETYRGK